MKEEGESRRLASFSGAGRNLWSLQIELTTTFRYDRTILPPEFLRVSEWQLYEDEIENQFREAYPTARVTRDAKLIGKFSKVNRQIDILIEEQASDFDFRIVVDAKHRGRKLDVGDVEEFLGLVRDVEAHGHDDRFRGLHPSRN